MSTEYTALLNDTAKKDDNGATDDSSDRKLNRLSRFGSFESTGVQPDRGSSGSVPDIIRNVPRQRKSSLVNRKERKTGRSFIQLDDGGDVESKKKMAKSFMVTPDGVHDFTPLEMGRHELYEELPFMAVPGLQKKEHNMSIAFSSFAAFLDNKETEEYLIKTTGKGMDSDEKEKRMSRMSMMMLDELEEEAVGVTLPLVFAVAIASLLSFNVGYNIGIMNPAESVAYPGHSTFMWSIAVSAFCVGGPFGAGLAGKWADDKGRRGALLLTSWLFIIGGLAQTVAPNLYIVVLARTLIGVASGCTTTLVPIYLGELAPPNLRGVIGTMTQFALVIGIFFADVVAFPLANESKWRYMFLLISVMGICPLVMKPFFLESPRWLLRRNPNSEEARFTIKKLRGFTYDDQVETEVEHYVGAEKSQTLKSEDGDLAKGSPKNATAELFADKSVRLLLISSLVIQVSAQWSGINAVFFYSSMFFEGVIENPLVGTTLMGGINVLATYVAVLLMDKCGRRTLLMWSSAGMFMSCIMVVLSLLGYFSKTVSIVAVASYVSFFELGLGPIPALIVAELFDAKYVTTAMSISSQLNWVCNFCIGLFFPYMNKYLGAYSFGPFAVVLLLTFVYAWIWLPETQGTTPEELQAELIRKNAGVTYHNMDIEGSATQGRQTDQNWAEALLSLEKEDGIA